MKENEITSYFHHIHHVIIDGKVIHEVHHCGGEHEKINRKLHYNIKHCSCGKHSINKTEAIGHDADFKEVEITFKEACPEGGHHIESGRIMKNDT